MCQSSGEAAGETHQRPDPDRSDNDDEERYNTEYDVSSNDVVSTDVAEFIEHAVQHLQQASIYCIDAVYVIANRYNTPATAVFRVQLTARAL